MKTPSKRQMWIRRIISTTLLLAALALLIFGAIIFAQFIGKKYSVEQQERSSAVRATPIVVTECTNENLMVSTKPQPVNPAVGEGLKLGVSLENKGKNGCSLDTAAVQISLVTGEDTVWEPTVCADGWERQLLLSPAVPWETTLQWDGKIYDGCEMLKDTESGEGLVAEEGTYRVQVTANGSKLSVPTVVQVIW